MILPEQNRLHSPTGRRQRRKSAKRISWQWQRHANPGRPTRFEANRIFSPLEWSWQAAMVCRQAVQFSDEDLIAPSLRPSSSNAQIMSHAGRIESINRWW